ncbi:hypothetical protein ABZ946_37085 [Streptomyces sp. NPDC046324]|uniref:hypothetical protein n=1 Tax=Streptomyces sp. NPDC046324 TaxID=3154915 RepID=UPI0033C14ED6
MSIIGEFFAAPDDASAVLVQNSVDHLSMVPPPATTPVADRQERPQPFSMGIRQMTPPHAHINESGAEQAHARRDKS